MTETRATAPRRCSRRAATAAAATRRGAAGWLRRSLLGGRGRAGRRWPRGHSSTSQYGDPDVRRRRSIGYTDVTDTRITVDFRVTRAGRRLGDLPAAGPHARRRRGGPRARSR